MKTKPMHLRAEKFPKFAIHFIRLTEDQLTDDPSKVTCWTCLSMIERRKRWAEEGRR